MNCSVARDLILEAELATLEGESDAELSLHLRGCARCRAAAERILDAERSLRGTLAAATPRRPAADAVERAARRQGARARLLWRAVPLAAAAGLAALILTKRQPIPPGPIAAPALRPTVSVTAQPGRNVAVLQTDNPGVVVFWFF